MGRNRAKAELAYHRLGLLWDTVIGLHELVIPPSSVQFAPPGYANQRKPLWDADTLIIAEAIRKHQHAVRIACPSQVDGDSAYAAHLDYLRTNFGHIISILPGDEASAAAGREQHAQYAVHRGRQARLNARIADIPIPAGLTGTSLYETLDGYVRWVKQKNTKESGKVEAGNAQRLKNAISDMDLSEFGVTAIERMRDYWVARPEAKLRGGKGTGRPIGITTVDNHLSTTRRFVRWLDRSQTYRWEAPRHAMEALKVNLKRLRTSEEVAKLRHGVQVFTIP